MSTRDDGGPAFPVPGPTELPSNGIISDAYGGMTLRDYFAGQALASGCLFDARDLGATPFGDIKARQRFASEAARIATVAYALADAMLAAREAGSK